MELTSFLKSRQQGLSNGVSVENRIIKFSDINMQIDMEGWSVVTWGRYYEFMSKYVFPKNEEFKKKDREGVRENFPKPQILIQKIEEDASETNPIIAMYLYHKLHITGTTLMHIRSVNKFEQMWVPYFISISNGRRNNPTVVKKELFDYCQSSDFSFTYQLFDEEYSKSARLRILSFSFQEYIMLMYVFDGNESELSQNSLLEFINKIKAVKR